MLRIFTLLFLFVSFSFSKTLVFGVVPQQSPSKMYSTWNPIVKYLSKETNLDIIFKTEKSIPEFEKKLYSGAYDIAYSNPYHFTLANKLVSHDAILRFDKMIVGILVAKKDSLIKSIDDVVNKEFLFPAPKAFAATILTKYDILNKKDFDIVKSEKLKYVNSHDSVYLGVLRDIGDVGGGIVRTFNKFKNKNELKIIYKTDKYPSHPISLSSKISEEDKNKIKNALLSMPKELSKKVNPKTLKETSSSEYDVVKNLAIKLGIYLD